MRLRYANNTRDMLALRWATLVLLCLAFLAFCIVYFLLVLEPQLSAAPIDIPFYRELPAPEQVPRVWTV